MTARPTEAHQDDAGPADTAMAAFAGPALPTPTTVPEVTDSVPGALPRVRWRRAREATGPQGR